MHRRRRDATFAAVADPEEKRAALTFLKSEFRNGISSENELLSALKRRDDLLPPALRRMQGDIADGVVIA
ncbi:hypothetical protein [Rhizobium leguminosarum]|uniref:hypothetical protein n=1 Tax=Rhizobium leguminosarum TaxID=384 RepID=UPI0013E3ED26|nr:hypothetical protein [Rhizobium leguminosarum]